MRWTSKESLMRHEGRAGPKEGPCNPVFVFSGQGSQWTGMGRALLERSTVFALVLKACDAQVRRWMGWSLVEALTAEDARLGDIEVSCPAIVSMEIALAALWRSWGIEPAAVVGHSIGEVAAAHVAGVLSLEDAMRVICHQGRTVGKLKGQGAMAVVGLPWGRVHEVLPEYAGRLWRVIHASPEWTVVAAEPPVLEQVLGVLRRQGVPARRVDSEVAAHCPQVDPYREELHGLLRGLRPRSERLPIISTVTGGALAGPRFDAGYWVRNLAEPVLFREAVGALLDGGHNTFLEVSPHPLVKHSLESCLESAGRRGRLFVSMRRGKEPAQELLGTLQSLSRPAVQERQVESSLSNAGEPFLANVA
ncbi:acyltransferase domain-containing protein [Archangium lansingense]|uniref:Acyltransferase domain-containing protein n=1 Tax=Archangium lansingense TaxID=2995310 RepID=A0ABT4AA19_9BACT|nr:acyltransferase domain-containing protein [Archangium lansinium]MCY1078416.1 acyltransferase domain-containing protein [Archangium lansinium]